MANGTLTPGNSNLLLGPLGNVYIGFAGYILGKTTADTALSKDEDVKDIKYSQDGTKAADHISTGMLLELKAEFGEVSTALLEKIMYFFSSKQTSGDDSGTFGRYIYKSLRSNKAGALKVFATDSSGNILTAASDVMNFYEVVPVVDANLINWGADTQRNVPVKFRIYYHPFGGSQVVGGPAGAFGYYGDNTVEKVPALTWPTDTDPKLVSATVLSATQIKFVFSQAIALQGGSYSGGIVAKVNGIFKAASAVSVSTTDATVTFPAASFATGNTVEGVISSIVFEASVGGADFQGVAAATVTNPL